MQYFENLTLPPAVQSRLEELALRQATGTLSAPERHELDSLIKVRELLAQLRAKSKATPALISTGRTVRNGLPVVLVPAGTQSIDPDAVRRIVQEATF